MTVAAPMSTRDTLTQALANLSEEQFTAAASYLEAVIEAAQTGSLNKVRINDFRKSFNLKRLFKPALTQLIGVVLPPKDKSLDDRIKKGGYDWHATKITAHKFPVTRDTGPQPLFLAHFGVDVNSDEVEEWSKANGYAVANNDDLLAVGSSEQYKDLQREFPIVQLGSSTVVYGRRYTTYLCGGRSGRRLHSCFIDDCIWHSSNRFLLRKVS
ncbi:MAG: hypothetical protein WC750_06660 [Patescibacteria group bacterium]|jgi:hypothetical protein